MGNRFLFYVQMHTYFQVNLENIKTGKLRDIPVHLLLAYAV